MDLLTILIILVVLLWVGGFGLGYTAGGAIHLLVLLLIVLIVVKVARGERV